MTKKKLSPPQSATDFSIGTVGLGNDGNLWKIVKTKTGVKKWKLINKTIKNK